MHKSVHVASPVPSDARESTPGITRSGTSVATVDGSSVGTRNGVAPRGGYPALIDRPDDWSVLVRLVVLGSVMTVVRGSGRTPSPRETGQDNALERDRLYSIG